MEILLPSDLDGMTPPLVEAQHFVGSETTTAPWRVIDA
jgi:hypothetical protein